MENCNKTKPAEIQRNIRGLKFLKYWKGTEYSVFLSYLGILILPEILNVEAYEHFMLLSLAITILSSKHYISKYIHIADQLIKDYLEGCIDIYGIDSISSNFHNLCHVVEDTQKLGFLNGISTYPFENHLGHIKSLLRSGNKPLVQVAKRIKELSHLNSGSCKATDLEIYLKSKIKLSVVGGNEQTPTLYNKIIFGNCFMLSNDEKNSWFLTNSGEIVSMKHALTKNYTIYIRGFSINNKKDLFAKPFASSKLNIFRTEGVYTDDDTQITFVHSFKEQREYKLSEIKCKLFSLRHETTRDKNHKNKHHIFYAFFPLIHTLDVNVNDFKMKCI